MRNKPWKREVWIQPCLALYSNLLFSLKVIVPKLMSSFSFSDIIDFPTPIIVFLKTVSPRRKPLHSTSLWEAPSLLLEVSAGSFPMCLYLPVKSCWRLSRCWRAVASPGRTAELYAVFSNDSRLAVTGDYLVPSWGRNRWFFTARLHCSTMITENNYPSIVLEIRSHTEICLSPTSWR